MGKWIFCVDSDGCVMDTMTYKHTLFFGPLAAEIFEVEQKEQFLKDWNIINLYSKTRGINRFSGLLMTLEKYHVPSIERLKYWVLNTTELSNQSLKREIDQYQSEDLKKALKWSEEVNQQISTTKGLDKPFENALSTLKKLQSNGKVVVVSSANKEAVEEEWQRHGLLEFVDELYCQDKGKKEDIIHQLIQNGAVVDNMMMIGDSPGDLDAAKKNQIFFYPILVNKEKISWQELNDIVISQFLSNKYSSEQKQYIQKFWENLNGK